MWCHKVLNDDSSLTESNPAHSGFVHLHLFVPREGKRKTLSRSRPEEPSTQVWVEVWTTGY